MGVGADWRLAAGSGSHIAAAVIALTLGLTPALAEEYANLVQSRFVHCAFYRNYEQDVRGGNLMLVEGRAHSLIHYQGIDAQRARAINTRVAGSRNVRVVQTAKYLHFIDSIEGLYRVTTVHGCLERDERRGVCITYDAAHARHFNSRVLKDPDQVFEGVRAHAEPGFCDYSFIGVQEASRGE